LTLEGMCEARMNERESDHCAELHSVNLKICGHLKICGLTYVLNYSLTARERSVELSSQHASRGLSGNPATHCNSTTACCCRALQKPTRLGNSYPVIHCCQRSKRPLPQGKPTDPHTHTASWVAAPDGSATALASLRHFLVPACYSPPTHILQLEALHVPLQKAPYNVYWKSGPQQKPAAGGVPQGGQGGRHSSRQQMIECHPLQLLQLYISLLFQDDALSYT